MLSFPVADIELLVMEDQIHLTISGTVCAVILGVTYWFFSSREAEEVAMLRKVTGLKSGDEKLSRQPIQLGPHSYKLLIFSLLSCTVWLAVIWLIRITPFEKLYKGSPLYKLVKILFNSPDLELEEDDKVTRGSPELTARHQQILDTCRDLEMRMSRLERCLTPLARSLQTLTDVIESRDELEPMDRQESQAMDPHGSGFGDRQQPQVMDLLAQIADFDRLESLPNSDSKIIDRLDSKATKDRIDSQIADRGSQDANPVDSQGTGDQNTTADSLEFQFKNRPDPRAKVGNLSGQIS